MMKNTTFRQLQVFESISRNGTFTAAAEELFLTQPTLSMQMKKLTATIGVPLYDQIGKKIHLTEAGKELLATSKNVFNSFSEFEMKILNMKGVKEGNLKLAGVTTAEYFAPRILGAFCQRYPGIKVSLEVTNRQRVLQRLADNLDDLYIVGHANHVEGIHITPFLSNPLVVLAPTNHRLANEKHIPLTELANEHFLMRETGCGTIMTLDQLMTEHGFRFKSSMELGSNEAIKQAVIGGLGISMLSMYALAHELQTGELAILDIQGFPVEEQWYIVYPEGKKLSIVAQAFFDYLLDEGRKITQGSLYTPTPK